MQQAVLKSAQEAETRGWALSRGVAADSTGELKAKGMKVDRIPADFEAGFQANGREILPRMGTRILWEQADDILFVPYYIQR